MTDPSWWMQERFTGEHLVISKTPAGVEAVDVVGCLVNLPEAVAQAAEKIRCSWAIEGVYANNVFIAFDFLEIESLEFTGMDYMIRMAGLRELLTPADAAIRIAETVIELTPKVALFQRLRAAGKGFVLKKRNGIDVNREATARHNVVMCSFETSQPDLRPEAQTSI
jgi:hypothetical protein